MTVPPTDDALRATLADLAREHLGADTLPDGDLAEHFDSMQRLALVVAIEDHFHVAFEPGDDEAARTVDDVIAILRRRLSEADRG